MDVARKHRSHISSKHARVRGWRPLTVKGSGKAVMSNIPVSVMWEKYRVSGASKEGCVSLKNEKTGEVFRCTVLKSETTLHVQYSKMRLVVIAIQRYGVPTRRYSKSDSFFSGLVSKGVYELLKLIVTTSVKLRDEDVDRICSVSSFTEFSKEFTKVALERAIDLDKTTKTC